LLLDLKIRGLQAPKLAIGDREISFGVALKKVCLAPGKKEAQKQVDKYQKATDPAHQT